MNNETHFFYTKTGHLTQIDLLKGFAIISVILLHTWPKQILLITGAPFHIWQAVPIFILVAGYVSSLSYLRHGTLRLCQAYNISLLVRRFKRILIPFVIVFFVEIVLMYFLSNNGITTKDIISSFITGGYGPGSYFIPIIIQHILVLPVLYILAKRNPKYFLVITFLLSLIFEYLMVVSFVPEWMYRLLYVRYLFAAALGVWLAISSERPTKWLLIGALISFIYIFAVNYLDFQALFLYPAWGSQHAPSYFWTLIIVIAGLLYLPEKSTNIIHSVIEKLGQASWHIFLVQMVFFFAAGGAIRSLFFIDFALSNILDISTLIQMSTSCFIVTCVNLGICLSLGYIFFFIENEFGKGSKYDLKKIVPLILGRY